jgi:Tfp pilus assembly protein PilZ
MSPDPKNDPSVTSLEVRYASRRALLSAAKSERGSLTLFVPTQRVVAQGTRVRLTIIFEDADARVFLEGLALNRTQAVGRDGVGGFLVAFQGEHKRRAAEMVALCAGRPTPMGTASRERLPIRKNCHLKVADEEVDGVLRDLSQTGAFVICHKLSKFTVGDPVWLKVEGGLFGLGGIWLEARLVWKGEKGEERGLGLRFTGNEARQASAIQRLLERAGTER